MIIDLHAHWRPPAFIDAMRARSDFPRIETNAAGIEVIRTRNTEEPVSAGFDDPESKLAEMARHGVTTAVLSMFGGFSWATRLPAAESLPLMQLYNDSVAAVCAKYPGRFVAYAEVPHTDIAAAAAEFDRAMSLPGMIGIQLPSNAFATRQAADQIRPILEVANQRKAVVFVHNGPLPGDPWPVVPGDIDNARRRNGTLDMQANLSRVMVTLCLTDFLEAYPEARIHVHNLGGNIPFEIERMDHRCLLDTPHEELPSKRFARSRVFVDCNSFGPHAIEMGYRLYGGDRILFGTDGTEFGMAWSVKAVNDASIPAAARARIFHGNASTMFGHLAPIAGADRIAA